MNSIIDIQNTLADIKGGFVSDHHVPNLYVAHVEFLLSEIARMKNDIRQMTLNHKEDIMSAANEARWEAQGDDFQRP